MKSYTCDIACMTFESEEWARIRRPYVIELHIVGSGRSEEALVRGYAKSIDL